MSFFLVTRAHHDEVLAEVRKQLADAERKLHRLEDLIFKQQFGVQLHDTLPADMMPAPEPEKELTAEEKEVARIEAQEQAETARLRALARTRPSQLGSELERVMVNKTLRMAKAAHPTHTVAAQVFEQARKEAVTQ
jgi:hypothetical protein